METKKRRIWLIVSAVLSVVILGLVILLQNEKPSPQYQEYLDQAKIAGVPPIFTEEDANARATDVCAWFDKDDVTEFPMNYTVSFRLTDEVIPLVRGYCPRNGAMAQAIYEVRGYGDR